MASKKGKTFRWVRRLVFLAVVCGAIAAIRNQQLEANERRYAPSTRGSAAA